MEDSPEPGSTPSEKDETWEADSPRSESGASGLAPGAVIAGRYRIEAYLAAGGMGQVYRARDLVLDVLLALKTIRPEIASNPASLRRFKQEVLLARAVSHPNVCRIFDLGLDDPTGVLFLTMEFLPGDTLFARIEARGVLPSEDSLPLVRQMAAALDAAHRVGIVHRDFKSPNVMVVPDGRGGRAVITDFGLAIHVGTLPEMDPESPAAASGATQSVAGGIVGTPAYMSPEQVRGAPIGPASDLYALGVVLFEMRTGRVPFRGVTPVETAQAHLTMQPPSPRSLVDIEETWERTILRLLSKKPEERYPTAHDAVLALEGRSGNEAASHHLLPPEQDEFIGRAVELEALASRLGSGARLLTLQGPGGTGKTRLVTKYGWESLERWPGGVWFCDLSEALTAEGIVAAVAKSLDVPLGKDDPVVRLGHAIAGRGKCLLILDNFEQLVAHADATLGRWLERATEASFLVTSQERLQLRGETTLELEPLDPTTQGVELFEVRARGHRAGFVVDDSNRDLVEAIVRSLDGLPLAIELAAARLRMLSPEQLLARLKDRFQVLGGGGSGRHAALRTTLDWSWDLLQSWERSAMAQVSVFEGGSTLEAAEAVVDLSAFAEEPFVLDVLQSLVDKSWLRAKVVRGAPRFEMYTTVQEYASARLRTEGPGEAAGRTSPEIASPEITSPGRDTMFEAAVLRHGAYFAEMGTDDAIDRHFRHGSVEVVTALGLELDNLVVACRRAITRGDENVSACCYVAADTVIQLRGPLALSVQLGSETLGLVEEPRLRARVLRSLGDAKLQSGLGREARTHYEAALTLARGMGDRRFEGIMLGSVATSCLNAGQTEEALAHYEASLAIHQEMGNRRLEGVGRGNLGGTLTKQGRMDEALHHYEVALAIAREIGNRGSEGAVLGSLGTLQMNRGRMEMARENFEAALVIHREMGNRLREGLAYGNLGILHANQGRLEDAGACFEAALKISREVGDRAWEGIVLSSLGGLDHKSGRKEQARAYYEAALAIHRETGNRRSEGIVLGNVGVLLFDDSRIEEARTYCEAALALHRKVGNLSFEGTALIDLGRLEAGERPDEARRHYEEGLSVLRKIGDELELLNSLCTLGKFEVRLGRQGSARKALAEAESIAAKLEVTAESDEALAIEALRQALEG